MALSFESPTIMFYARIDDAPGALARLLLPFDVLGLTPIALTLRRSPRASLFVAATFEGVDLERASLLAQRLEQVPAIRRARCVALRLRTPRTVIGERHARTIDA